MVDILRRRSRGNNPFVATLTEHTKVQKRTTRLFNELVREEGERGVLGNPKIRIVICSQLTQLNMYRSMAARALSQ